MTTKEETMAKLTKKQKATAAIVDSHKFYDVDEAVKLLKEAATAKFDETRTCVQSEHQPEVC